MRPPGEIRSAICETLRNQGPMPLVDLVQRVGLQTTPDAIGRTVENALRAGVITKVRSEKRSHCNKLVAVYDLANVTFIGDREQDGGGIVLLDGVLRDWR